MGAQNSTEVSIDQSELVESLRKEITLLKETNRHQSELLANQEVETGSNVKDAEQQPAAPKHHKKTLTLLLPRSGDNISHEEKLDIVPAILTMCISFNTNVLSTPCCDVYIKFFYHHNVAVQTGDCVKQEYDCEVIFSFLTKTGIKHSLATRRLTLKSEDRHTSFPFTKLFNGPKADTDKLPQTGPDDRVQIVVICLSVAKVPPARKPSDSPGGGVARTLFTNVRAQRALDMGIGSDCEFLVGAENPKVLRAARLMLAIKSPVFETMFYGNWPQSKGPIRIPDVEPDVFSLFLRAAYDSDLTEEIKSCAMVEELYYVANKYSYLELMDFCVNFVTPNKVDDKFWSALHIATYYGHDGLWKRIVHILMNSAESVLSDEQFLKVPQDSILAILRQPEMNVTEDVVLDAVLAWGRARCREKDLPEAGWALRVAVAAAINLVRLLAVGNKFLLQKQEQFHFLTAEDFLNIMIMKNNPSRESDANLCPSVLPRNSKEGQLYPLECGC